MTARIDRECLELGACFALAHSAQLLEDAAALYSAKRGSSSFHLAVMAREELGRFHLLSARRHSLADDQAVDAKEIVESLKSHTKKLQASNFIFAVPFAPGEEIAWKSAIEQNDAVTAERISNEMHERARKRRSAEVDSLHKRRLKAQYVDIDAHTGQWSRPSEVTMAEASTLIRCAMAEIANALIASQSAAWIHASFTRTREQKPEMGPFTHRVFACLAKGDA